jgi:hypothetical protein
MDVTRIEETELVKDALVGATSRVGARAIIAGVLAACAIELLLLVFGAALGLSVLPSTKTTAGGTGIFYYAWLIGSLCASAFFGAWVASAAARSPAARDGVLNGFVLWASVTVIGTVLVGGAFLRAVAAMFVSTTAQPTPRDLDLAGISMWGFFIALGAPLVFALLGGLLGARQEARRFGLQRKHNVLIEEPPPEPEPYRPRPIVPPVPSPTLP